MNPKDTPDLEEQKLAYNARNYGKSFKAWQQFLALSDAGEDIVYRTRHGDICSPARVQKLIHQHHNALIGDIEDVVHHKIKVLNIQGFEESILNGQYVNVKHLEQILADARVGEEK